MNNIKYVPTKSWHANRDGAATAEAAAAMLARVYLFYTGYYGQEHEDCTKQEAIDALMSIYNGGHYALVQSGVDEQGTTFDGFTRLWRAAIASDKGSRAGLDNHAYVGRACELSDVNEFIFSMKFNYTTVYYDGSATPPSTGNRWLVMMGLRGVTDVNAVPYGRGWGACSVNPNSLAIFDNSDARYMATIIDYVKEGKTSLMSNEIVGDMREYSGYNLKKYIPLSYNIDGVAVPEVQAESEWEGENDFQISQYQDYIVMRYSDVLLMLSELTENVQYMTEVRNRAGLGAIAYSKDNLLAERHREFMGEGIRYWDLLRQGVDYAANAIAGTWTLKSGGNNDVVTISMQSITSKRGLCRIPDNQITLSANVYQQNPGWE